MGMSMKTVSRLFWLSVILALVAGYTQSSAIDGAMVFSALILLFSFSWCVVSWQDVKKHLGMSQANVLAVGAYCLTSLAFGFISIEIWSFPALEAYIVGFILLATIWWTMHAMQPANA